MLMVPVILKKSQIKGKGIFAKNKIKQGTLVIRIGEKERYYSKEQYRKLPPKYRKMLDRFTYWDKKQKRLVYPLDNTKYLNHSCEPNVLNKGDIDIAARDIKSGEELTYDYSPILFKGVKYKCSCGSKHCQGLVKSSL